MLFCKGVYIYMDAARHLVDQLFRPLYYSMKVVESWLSLAAMSDTCFFCCFMVGFDMLMVEWGLWGLFFFCEFCDMFFHVVWICLGFIVFWNRTDAVLNWVAILKTLLFQLHVGPPWLKDLPILWKSSSEENMGSICENPMDIGDDTAIWLLKYVDSISIWLNMAIFYFMFPMSHFWSWWKEKGSLI